MALPENYFVKINMAFNQYVVDNIQEQKFGKNITIERNAQNPSPERIVQTIISKVGSRFSPREPEKWKTLWIEDVNNAEGKKYDKNMSMEEFVKVLQSEGVITIEETAIKEQEEEQEEKQPEIKQKGRAFF